MDRMKVPYQGAIDLARCRMGGVGIKEVCDSFAGHVVPEMPIPFFGFAFRAF
jgi:hypothetical protein